MVDYVPPPVVPRPRRDWSMVRLHREEKLRLDLLKAMWEASDLNAVVKRLLDMGPGTLSQIASTLVEDSDLYERLRQDPKFKAALRKSWRKKDDEPREADTPEPEADRDRPDMP